MRALGIDMGKVRIGTAVCDPAGIVATPAKVIESKGHKKNALAVAELADAIGAELIVVGMPVRMDGTEGPAAEFVKRFVDELRAVSKTVVLTWDERLTSAQAQKLMISADVSRKGRKEAVDSMAAAIMLQSFLDSRSLKGS